MDTQLPPNNTSGDTTNGYNSDFDPTKDIDISNIEIIDTSKGDKIDYGTSPINQVYNYKCNKCNFKYEGNQLITKCPKCGSDDIVDL